MQEFLFAAKDVYKNTSVNWLNGSLPNMECLSSETGQFDFALIDGVWHYLDNKEREAAIIRLSQLIKQGGRCAISLRNGPAGMGSRVYPTDSDMTITKFGSYGFKCIFHTKNQSSILPNKEDVKWSRIVLQKS